MMERFEQDEYYIMAMFRKGNRRQTMEEIETVLPFVEDDEEMHSIVNSTLEKMGQLSDEQFLQMELDIYEEEPMEGEEWT